MSQVEEYKALTESLKLVDKKVTEHNSRVKIYKEELKGICQKYNVKSIKELEEFFKTEQDNFNNAKPKITDYISKVNSELSALDVQKSSSSSNGLFDLN